MTVSMALRRSDRHTRARVDGTRRGFSGAKTAIAQRRAASPSGCGTGPSESEARLLADIPQAGPNLDGRRSAHECLVAVFQTKQDSQRRDTAVFVGVIHREAAFDLALAGLVGLAVAVGLRARVVAPVPFDRGAVELLVVVGAADELSGEDDPCGRDRHQRLRLEHQFGPSVALFRIFVLILFLVSRRS